MLGRSRLRFFGGVAPWSMPLTNLAAWFDATFGVTSSAGAVSSWSDKSPTGENLLLQSNTFSNAVSWYRDFVTVIQGQLDPIGGVAAWTMTAAAGALGEHRIYQPYTITPTHARSIYVKAGTVNFVSLSSGTTAAGYAVFDLSLGTVVSSSGGSTGTITLDKNGFYRISITGGTVQAFLVLNMGRTAAEATPQTTWTPTGTETVIIYNAQVNYGTTAGVSTVTTTAAITHSLVQATGANRPTLTTDAQGRSCILFNGISHKMATAGYTDNQPVTRYMVFRQVTWTANNVLIDGLTANSGALVQTTTTPTLSINAGTAAAANTNVAVNTPTVIAMVFNGASSSITVGKTTPTTGNAGAGNPGGITLGANGGGAVYGNIQVYELAEYSAAHDAATQASIIQGLANKWGITI